MHRDASDLSCCYWSSLRTALILGMLGNFSCFWLSSADCFFFFIFFKVNFFKKKKKKKKKRNTVSTVLFQIRILVEIGWRLSADNKSCESKEKVNLVLD